MRMAEYGAYALEFSELRAVPSGRDAGDLASGKPNGSGRNLSMLVGRHVRVVRCPARRALSRGFEVDVFLAQQPILVTVDSKKNFF